MNTENTATTPEATPATNIQAVDFSTESKQLYRKIARLPKPLRDLINSSLDDGLTAKEIIQKLESSTNPPLPYPISEPNISRWKTTGYLKYIAHQDHLDSIEASREAALEMAAGNNLSLPQATLQVIAGQCFEILGEFSPAAVKQKLAEDPLKYTSFLHVFARLTREIVHLEKFHEARLAAQAALSDPNRDREADAAKFWTHHLDTLFHRKDPRAIKTPSSPALHSASGEGGSSASSDAPTRASGFDQLHSRPTHHDSGSAPSDSSHESHPSPSPRGEGRGEGARTVHQPKPQREKRPAHPDSCSSIENRKSKIENSPVPAASKSKILEEHCLECHHPLPPLTPEGKRPNERCEQCNILLPPPGTCTRPSSDKCHHCGNILPRRLPNGRRPKYTCHNCGAGLGRELDEDIQKYAEDGPV